MQVRDEMTSMKDSLMSVKSADVEDSLLRGRYFSDTTSMVLCL
jgi:hypothetical protein